jgi:hypothetical protein
MAAHAAPTSKQAPSAEPSRGSRRRLPWWALSLVGTALAAVFGLVIEHLRFGPPFVMLCLGGATLGWASLALWRVLAPLFDEVPEEQRALREAPHHRRELEREKQLVLKAIKEVELDFQMKKIAPEDYKDMSERYRARALRLLAELDAGDDVRGLIERELKLRLAAMRAAGQSEPAVSPVPDAAVSAEPAATPAGTCTACGTPNDTDAVFCKKCGSKLSLNADTGAATDSEARRKP